MDFYASRKAQINKEKFKLDDTLEGIQKQLAEKTRKLYADDDSTRKRGVRVSIVVLADSEGEAELSLKYIVSGASWTPQYDLRATIPSDEKNKPSVHLHYRASIAQTTGEDWTDVNLSLSTATPIRASEIPSLKPTRAFEASKSEPIAPVIVRQPSPGIIIRPEYQHHAPFQDSDEEYGGLPLPFFLPQRQRLNSFTPALPRPPKVRSARISSFWPIQRSKRIR